MVYSWSNHTGDALPLEFGVLPLTFKMEKMDHSFYQLCNCGRQCFSLILFCRSIL